LPKTLPNDRLWAAPNTPTKAFEVHFDNMYARSVLIMKNDLYTKILTVVLFIGLSLLLYPPVSNYWNSLHQSGVISNYVENVAQMSNDEYDKVLSAAKAYNEKLSKEGNMFQLSDEEEKEYESMLSISQDGTMGYIEIPSINCTLPIYHGTSASVLESGVGHIAGSSLPVGGKTTHCVLSSHRGLPSARLFTDIDQLVEGDIFILRTLDETLTYEVDQILIVTPDDTSALQLVKGEDLCTLVTCTPYGVNTHRLLVRGHRIANAAAELRVTADATLIESITVAPFVGVPIIVLIWLWIIFTTRDEKSYKAYKKCKNKLNVKNVNDVNNDEKIGTSQGKEERKL
jgi:sortase A